MMYKVPYVDFGKEFRSIELELIPAICCSLSKGNIILRDEVHEFENIIANYIGVKHAIGVNSGTDAIFLSLLASGLRKGGEIITVSHTCVATLSSIIHAGFVPVCVDVANDFNIDVDKIESAITENTVAIVPVHLGGRCCNMHVINRIADAYNLMVIEDACQAIGSKYFGKMAGSFGYAGCFSFHPMKILGCYGDGGMIVTDSSELDHKVRYFRNLSTDKNTGKIFSFGYNSRLDNVQAVALMVKFPHLNDWIMERQLIADAYVDSLSDINDVILPNVLTSNDYFDTFYSFTIRIANGKRDALKEYLRVNGIETMIYWCPAIHENADLQFRHDDLTNTKKLSLDSLSLPIYPAMSDAQIECVTSSIKSFFERN